jgi:hypothetical protein
MSDEAMLGVNRTTVRRYTVAVLALILGSTVSCTNSRMHHVCVVVAHLSSSAMS